MNTLSAITPPRQRRMGRTGQPGLFQAKHLLQVRDSVITSGMAHVNSRGPTRKDKHTFPENIQNWTDTTARHGHPLTTTPSATDSEIASN